ncbi:MAG: NADH-quinone oxidoreductase subunit L [Planctomycetota bacterium]
MLTLALVCLFAPVVGFLVQYFFGRHLPRKGDIWTVAAMGVSLACALLIAWRALHGEGGDWSMAWFHPFGPGSASLRLGLHVDGLTAAMLCVVTLVSFVVHIHSIGYMRGDGKYANFFAWLQLFTVSMLLLVLADNLLLLFVGWELVGLSSYKLIGFWSEKQAPADAGRKAFITTRIGDVGIVVALMVIWSQVGSYDFSAIAAAVGDGTFADPWLTVAGFGLLAGAAGKSAQFGFHVWLPDAMEGPTPVSALIHAATMVAAGVYLLGRFMFMLTPDVLLVVATLGAVTALFSGFIALAQDDIKKVLAYSTISQLGYMFLGLGVGAWHAALFHLATHAFFKALLFLGSGSVIIACHHEQDMGKMGGLWKKLPVTGTTFLVGVLAISGLPFLSGFYSKDAILSGAYHRFPILFWIGLAAAVLTAFYMARLFIGTFLGKPRDERVHEHAHEGGFALEMPLVTLALLAVIGGWGAWHTVLLAPPTDIVVNGVATVGDLHFEHNTAVVMPLAIAAGIGGLLLGWIFFSVLATSLDRIKRPFRPLEGAFRHKFWFDELYREILLRPAYALARLSALFDVRGVDGVVNAVGRNARRISRLSGRNDAVVVDGLVNGVGATAMAGGSEISRLQNGRVRFYLSVAVGVVAVLLVLVKLL